MGIRITLGTILLLLSTGASEASNCSLFSPCKAKPAQIRTVKPNLKPSTDVVELKARVAKLEEQAQSYVKTIAIMHQHIAMLQAQINRFSQSKEAAKN